MLKSLSKFLGIALSLFSLGSMASAGSLAEGLADPEVEELVIEEEDNRSIGILPIVGLLVIGAIIASSGGSDSGGGGKQAARPAE